MNYPHLPEMYDLLSEEHHELQCEYEQLAQELTEAIDAIKTVFGELDIDTARRILSEHPEIEGLL